MLAFVAVAGSAEAAHASGCVTERSHSMRIDSENRLTARMRLVGLADRAVRIGVNTEVLRRGRVEWHTRLRSVIPAGEAVDVIEATELPASWAREVIVVRFTVSTPTSCGSRSRAMRATTPRHPRA
jgi:hypothetical protein